MEKKYYSKVNLWLTLIFIYPIYLGVLKLIEGNFNGLFVLIIIVLLIIIITKTTSYTLKENSLIIKDIMGGNKIIEIATIKAVSEVKTLISQKSISTNRIRISYNKFDDVVISPKDLDHFLVELKKINPEIVIDF
jgi:hypothetical protein